MTVLTAGNAWAVGSYAGTNGAQTLVEHWNGAAWSVVPSPNPGGSGSFLGVVSAVSAVNAWAAGDVSDRAGQHTLILRWNGTAWTRAPSPNPGGSRVVESLRGVAAISAANAWIAGYISNSASYQSLILHWNGIAWTRTASPNPGSGGDLIGIAASPSDSIWAVGQFGAVGANDALAVRYCASARG